jgi:hypothetical protein
VSLTQAVKEIKTEFPKSDIVFCTVIPRKGKGQHIVKYNEITNSVNALMKQICVKENATCIDFYELFSKCGNVVKSLYDISDATGIHISVEGCSKMRYEFLDFVLRNNRVDQLR